MTSISAVYRHGVSKPLEPVNLQEDQKVHLSIEPANDPKAQAWLDEVRAVHNGMVLRAGALPDSTQEIAADRLR